MKKERKREKKSKKSSKNSDGSSSSSDSETIRSIITGKKIKRYREETVEDKLSAIERAAKRQFMNSQL
jgi:hypothetical protein